MAEPGVTLAPDWVAATIVAIVVQLVAPLAAGWIVGRRLGVGWRFFGYGALVFLVFQVLTRVPLVQAAQLLLQDALRASPVLGWVWIAALSLSAGLFEEVGRWVGYRWLFRPEQRSWRPAVMYGLGHGGLESMLLIAGLSALSLVGLLTVSGADLAQLPPEQRAQAQAQLAALAAQPAWLPLLGAWERLSALALHVGLSLLVLQAFRHASAARLLGAILVHGAANFVAVGLLTSLGPATPSAPVLVEVAITLMAALVLWLGLRSRNRDAAPRGASAADGG